MVLDLSTMVSLTFLLWCEYLKKKIIDKEHFIISSYLEAHITHFVALVHEHTQRTFSVFSSGEHTYFYQLFMEKDENLLLPTTQKLVELSFLQGNVKLKQVKLFEFFFSDKRVSKRMLSTFL